ncbi:MAG TPA: IPT/TIG domain-containing protein [Blastocatellia bacterium]|nr:IPT/TIG domain-containing protein [Blastocatellia bacterium]
MRPNRRPATLVACLLLLSLIVAQGSDHRTRLSQVRSLSLPSSAVLDEHAQPLIASSGKVGFVASVTGGSLISFSLTSGKILSSITVGENVGAISMIETTIEAAGKRLIAVPAANDPKGGGPATVTIVDATSAKRLELKSLLVLPRDAQVTSATRAVLTFDGRFCVIASSFDVPTLYSFDVQTGELVSHLALIGRPSEIALFDDTAHAGRRLVAIASAEKNNLSLIKVDDEGRLSSGANFSPSIARFDGSNNPEFSADGRTVYIAGSTGDRLFAVDSESGAIIDSISVASPERITVATGADGIERIGVMRVRRSSGDKPGGVTIVGNQAGGLSTRSEFSPPEGIDFSSANNVAFTDDASIAFAGSTSGMLFAFDTATGELESYQKIGSELHRIALSEKARSIAVVRSGSGADEVVMVSFDVVGSDGTDPASPRIDSLTPETVEQGRVKNLRLVVSGQNLTEGSSLIVNGVEVGADLTSRGRALETKLPKSLFDRAAPISIQIKAANGAVSEPRSLGVVRPGAPVIDGITPAKVPGPSGPFALKVTGSNFRVSSTILVGGQALNTRQVSSKVLQATVPADIAGLIRKDPLKVQVKDLAVSDLVSANEKELMIFGPRVTALKASVGSVVAGDSRFTLKITGDNFREGSQVEINGAVVAANRVVSISRNAIKVAVPNELFQEAGRLKVIVRGSGGESNPRELAVHGPEIASFRNSRLFAGVSDARVDIVGRNFRKRARVYVKSASNALEIPAAQVRFRNSTHITVSLGNDLKGLLAKPDTLQFEVVNRNRGDGVPSASRALDVVGPSVTDALIEASGGAAYSRIIINGANFRRGAVIDFVKNDAIVLQQAPVKANGKLLTAMVRARTLEALGDFQVRVVNPGNSPVPSNRFHPRRADSLAHNDD